MSKSKKHLWDIILIGFCLVLAAALFFVLRFGKEQGAEVVVKVDGMQVARYSLLQNGTYELNGGTNTLVIENGQAYLSHANCPDQLCVKQGKKKLDGQTITCLPNKLTVTVVGGQSDNVDIIS